MELVLDVSQTVTAVSTDGAFAVRRGAEVAIFAGERHLGEFLVRGKDAPGDWLGLAPGGEHLAHTSPEGWLELWDVRSGRPAWSAGDNRPDAPGGVELPMCWGPPIFLDARTFATHHQGGVSLWDVAERRPVRSIQHKALTLVRETHPLGPDTFGICCASNAIGLANTVLFFASRSEGALRGVSAPLDSGPKRAFQQGELRTLSSGGLVRAEAPGWIKMLHTDAAVTALAVDPGGQRITFGSMEGLVIHWELSTDLVALLETGGAPILHLQDDGTRLLALDARGRRWAVPRPEPREAAHSIELSDDAVSLEHALSALGLGDLEAAAQELEDIGAGSLPWHRLARVYVESLSSGEEADRFTTRAAEAGLPLRSQEARFGLIDLVRALLGAEQLHCAADLFLSWLQEAAGDPVAPKAEPIGLAIGSLLASIGATDLERALLRGMSEVFPANEPVRTRLRELG